MVQSSRPYSNQSWQNQESPQKSHKLLIFAIAACVVIFITVIVASVISSNTVTPVPETPATQTGDDDTKTETPLSTIEEDIQAYFISLLDDPEYEPELTETETRYSEPPVDLECGSLIEVKEMNQKLLDMNLQYGFVVAITGKGSAPFDPITANTVLIYSGDLVNSQYKTTSFTCPSNNPASNDYTIYSGKQIFENLASDQKYFVWIDPQYLTSGV